MGSFRSGHKQLWRLGLQALLAKPECPSWCTVISEHFGHEPAPPSLHSELDGAEIHLCTNSVIYHFPSSGFYLSPPSPCSVKCQELLVLSTWLLSSPPASGQLSVYQLADPLLMPAWALPNGGTMSQLSSILSFHLQDFV